LGSSDLHDPADPRFDDRIDDRIDDRRRT